MRIKHYTLIIAFLAICIGIPLMQGCTDSFDEHRNNGAGEPAKDGWMSVSMSVEGLGLSNPLTRSLTQEGENTTDARRIRVLVFDKDDNFSYEAKVTSYTPSAVPADKKSKGTMTLLAKNTEAGNTSTFVMLANVASSTETETNALTGKTREEVMNLFTFSMPAGGTWNDGELPMWGVSNPITVNHSAGADPNLGTIYLVRAVARVDVGLNLSSTAQGASQFDEKAEGIDGITLTKIYFYNTNDKGRVVPFEIDSIWDAANRKAKKPSIPNPAPTVTQKIDKTTAIVNKNIVLRDVYVSEAVNTPVKATQGANGETLPDTDTGNYMKRPYIIVGLVGADKSNPTKETFFRIDYLKRTGTGDNVTYEYLPLLRNHRYLVNITNVGGPGFDNEDDAKKGPAANIMYNVVVWSESNMANVQYDGQYMLGVSRDQFTFYKHGGSLTANVQTTWPDGFTIENLPTWITYTVAPSDPDKTGNTDEKIVTFTVTETVNGDRSWPVDPADVGNALKAAYVKAGRMKWFLDFKQLNQVNLSLQIFADEACTQPLQFIQVHQYGLSYGEGDKVVTKGGHQLTAEEAGATVTFYVKTEPDMEPVFAAEETNRFVIGREDHLAGGIWKYTVSAPDITDNEEYFDNFNANYTFSISDDGKTSAAQLSLLQKEYNAIPYYGENLQETLLGTSRNVYLMDGNEKHYYVKANSEYQIELVSATADNGHGPMITHFDPVNERTPSVSGLPVPFTVADDLTHPTLFHGFAKFKITSPDGFFPDREFTVELVSGIIQPEANTYMVKAGANQGILIPVSRVNTAYEYYNSLLEHDVNIAQGLPGLYGGATGGNVADYRLNRLDDDDDWTIDILWTDIHNTAGSNEIERAGLATLYEKGGIGGKADTYIYLRPGSLPGNVLVELKSGKIKGKPTLWSWHIWIVKNYPTVLPVTRAGLGSPLSAFNQNSGDDLRLMSHMIGARDAANAEAYVTTAYSQYGMQYQWGRKDPFPAAGVRNNYLFYDGNGKLFDFLWEQRGDRANLGLTKPEEARGAALTMKQSIEKPNSIVSHQSFWQYECFPCQNVNYFNQRWVFLYLWNRPVGDGSDPELIGGKTVFDPSPYGFKIMSNREAYTLRFAYYYKDRPQGLPTPLPGTIYDGSYLYGSSGGKNCIFAVCQGRNAHAGRYLLNSTGYPAGWTPASNTDASYRRSMGFSVRPVRDPEVAADADYLKYLPQ